MEQLPVDQSLSHEGVGHFMVDRLDIGGRGVRFRQSWRDLWQKQSYPLPIVHFLGETIGLAVLLASTMKYEGLFTLQLQATEADAVVRLMVVEVGHLGAVRATARFDAAAVAAFKEADWQGADGAVLTAFFPHGGIGVFTVDHSLKDRYQGVVSLEQKSLSALANDYFKNSEQLRTDIRLCADEFQIGALLIQQIALDDPRDEEKQAHHNEKWMTALKLFRTMSSQELLAADLGVVEWVWRLYHQEDARFLGWRSFYFACRCSEKKTHNVLAAMEAEARADLADETGDITIQCSYCGTSYRFALGDFGAPLSEEEEAF